MLGLLVIFIGIIYLCISIYLVKVAMRKARQRGIAGWKWGVPAAVGMYLLVFWDHIPTMAARQYYCSREAGFTVYKTLEQWRRENPGVAETLTYKEISDSDRQGDDTVYHPNQRFDWQIDNERLFLSLRRAENRIIDIAKGEVLARYVDFRTGWGSLAIGANTPREYKFWLVNKSCEEDGQKVNRKKFFDYERRTTYLGRDN